MDDVLSKAIYASAYLIDVQDAYESVMDGDVELGETIMYEFPDDVTQVRIVPRVDNAEFTYMDQTYSFGEIDENTYGILTLAESEDCVGELKIEQESHAHTTTDPVRENEVEASCEGAGSYDEVIYCSSCNEELSRETITIPALGHVDEDNEGHCDRCGMQMTGGDHCKFCGKIHNGGFFDKLTGFFHRLFYRLTHLFGWA